MAGSITDEDVTVLDEISQGPLGGQEGDWNQGLTPAKQFEMLVIHGQVGQLLQNSFFRSLDKIGQVDALVKAVDNLVNKLDRMSQTLFRVSSTHPEGVRVNRLAANLVRLKIKLLDDFAKGIDVVAEISHKAKGEQQY